MKVESIHIAFDEKGIAKYVTSDISVPGLGKVEIKNCVSQETADRLAVEIIAVLRSKMGQPIEGKDKET